MILNTIEENINKMLEEVDKMAELELTPGTPCYEFQQDMIRHTANYRKQRNKDEKTIS